MARIASMGLSGFSPAQTEFGVSGCGELGAAEVQPRADGVWPVSTVALPTMMGSAQCRRGLVWWRCCGVFASGLSPAVRGVD